LKALSRIIGYLKRTFRLHDILVKYSTQKLFR
jgi:hypothetical protein